MNNVQMPYFINVNEVVQMLFLQFFSQVPKGILSWGINKDAET